MQRMSIEPSWWTFKNKTPNPEQTFESVVAKRLFCAKYDIAPETLVCSPGYAGIECQPIKTPGGWASFQAKYSHDGKQNISSFDTLQHAYQRKINGEYQLDIICCYSNGVAPKGEINALKDIEALAKANNVNLFWYYGDQIIEALVDNDNKVIRKVRQWFFEEHPQPPLINYSNLVQNTNGLYKYHFTSRGIPLVGRENEMIELSNFCIKANQNFLWWSIIGVGASGKSRLLLEFGNTLEKNDWAWGWYNLSSSSFQFENWKPDKNTLIVIDYIIGREKNLHRLYSAMAKLAQDDELLFQIRILLIERVEGQWFQELKYLPHYGSFISSTLFRESPLYISKLEENDLLILAVNVLDKFNSNSITPKKLVELTVSMTLDKAPLLIQLIAENKITNNANIEQITRKSIDQEKTKRWKPAMVNGEDEEILVLSTLCGGVLLQSESFSKSEAQDFFSKFNSFDKYSIMTGRPENTEYLQPLEPDLFGELLVLDKFSPNNPLNDNKSSELLQLALGVNNGRSLVAFFTKCAQDFPKHKSLRILKTPFSENGHGFLLWALTISNVIDVINFNTEEKLEIYEKTITGLSHFIGDAQIVEKVIFLRLLNNFSEGDIYREYLGYFNVKEPIVPQGQRTEKEKQDFYDSLMPKEYCETIITAFFALENEYKMKLIGPHLINVYHHLLIRMASDRTINFKQTISKYNELCGLLEKRASNNYFITIIAFHHLSSNLAICIWQFGRLRNEPGYRSEIADIIKSNAFKFSHIKFNGTECFVHTTELARIYQPLTIYYRESKQRKELIGLIKEFKSRFKTDTQPESEIYVGCCVQLSHGFKTKEDYNYFLCLYDECKILTDKYKTIKIVENFSLIVFQMLRNNNVEDYGHDDMFINDAIDLSIRYPNEEYGTLSKVFHEISFRYKKAIDAKDYDTAQKYIEYSIKIISSTKQIEYNEPKKVWPGEIAIAGLMDYIHNQHPLDATRKILELIHEAKYFALNQTLFQIPSLIFSEGQKAIRKGIIDLTERCKECLRTIKPYLPDNQTNYIDQLIQLL